MGSTETTGLSSKKMEMLQRRIWVCRHAARPVCWNGNPTVFISELLWLTQASTSAISEAISHFRDDSSLPYLSLWDPCRTFGEERSAVCCFINVFVAKWGSSEL